MSVFIEASATCPTISGFTQNGNKLYKVMGGNKKRKQARVACNDIGAGPATFRTDAEYNYIRSIMRE